MTSPSPNLERVIACLADVALDRTESGAAVWRAGTLDLAGGGVFGGELIAQSILIAAMTEPEMAVKSIAAVFPRGVKDTGTIEYATRALHTGNAYATSRIEVNQPVRDGQLATAYSASVMCHRPALGLDFQGPAAAALGDPAEARSVDLGLIPWECRVVGSTDINSSAAQPNVLQMWTRVPVRLPDTPALHQALLAFLSDLTLIGTALLPHEGWSQTDAHVTLRTSVISHQLVFHRPFRIDEWLLIDQHSPVAAGGSAYGSAHVYTQRGELVASYTQESMIKLPVAALAAAQPAGPS